MKQLPEDPLTRQFREKHPHTCASVCTTRGQKIFYFSLLLLLFCLLLYRWDLFVFAVSTFFMLIYLAAVGMKLIAGAASLAGSGVDHVKPDEFPADGELPVYTILLPLYREKEIADRIIPRIAALDYPKDKLDVKILLEQDDEETLSVLAKTPLPEGFSVIRVPDALPKTKPRACNFGLQEARGKYCVIFDAEDIPEPDQLKKAAALFRRDTYGKVACIQAKLNYHNRSQNLLTGLFTIEYTTYFDLVLPGMTLFHLPLPLGGTSNHFRTDILKQLGGWDPYNVTEDCELGIRISEGGWVTRVMDSTTWEEANSRLGNWIRQRSRWVKGFIQTHFSHWRNWGHTIRRLGLSGALGGYLAVGGSALMMLTNVLFWPLTLFYLFLLGYGVMHGESLWTILCTDNAAPSSASGIEIGPFLFRAWPLVYEGPGENPFLSCCSKIFFAASVFLFFANVFLIFLHGAACIRRKYHYLSFLAFLMPFYWVLISIGAWKGAFQILTKPSYWEKTLHGLDKGVKK